jgi:hypothetical protein
VRDLKRLGARYGFHEKTIVEVVKHLRYPKKRHSRFRADPWYYINTNNEWKNQLVVISKKEFEDHSPPKIREEDPDVDNHHDDDDDDLARQRYLEEEKESEAELDLLDE